MAKRTDNSNNDNNDIVNSLSIEGSKIVEELKSIKSNTKEIEDIKTNVATIKTNTDSLSEIKTNTNKIDNISTKIDTTNETLGRIESALNNLKISRGAPVQTPVSVSSGSGTKTSSSTALVPVGGSKIMGTVPQAALPNEKSATAQIPGKQILGLPGPTTQSPAQVAQGNRLVNSIKGVGTGIKNFLGGKAFWGKMAGAVAEGLIGSKLFGNAIGDLIKLGVFLISNFVRNFFGKKWGGITAILLTMAASMIGFKQGLRFLKSIPGLIRGTMNLIKALRLGHGAKFAYQAFQAAKRGTSVAKTVVSKTTEKVAEKVGSKVLSKEGSKFLAKGVGKSIGKKAPLLGAAMGAGFAIDKFSRGDYLGAAGELASGLLPTAGYALAPWTGGASIAVGNAASFGLDAWLMKRDWDIAGGKKVMGMKGAKGSGEAIKTVTKSPILRTLGKIAIGITIISDIIQKIWHFFNRTSGDNKGLWSTLSNKVSDFFTPAGGTLSDGTIKGTNTPAGKILEKVNKGKSYAEQRKALLEGVFPGFTKELYGTGNFGDPRTGHTHGGHDLTAKLGTGIPSVTSGQVIQTGYEAGGYGKFAIVLSDDKKTRHVYAHMNEISVKQGQAVKMGQKIGLVGTTGHTEGVKKGYGVLHYETLQQQNGKWVKVNSVPIISDMVKDRAKKDAAEEAKKKADEEAKKKTTSEGSIPTVAQKVAEKEKKLLKKLGVNTDNSLWKKQEFGEGAPTGYAADITKSVNPQQVASALPSTTSVIQTNKTTGLPASQSVALLFNYSN